MGIALAAAGCLPLWGGPSAWTLENTFLRRSFTADEGVFRTTEIVNKRTGSTVRCGESAEFALRLSQGTHRPETAYTLTAQDFRVASTVHSAGELTATLEHSARGITVTLVYTAAPGQPVLRKRLTVTSREPLVLERVDVEVLALPDAVQPYTERAITANAPGRWSPGLGQPLYGARSATFWGVEFPAADNRVRNGVLTAGYLWGRRLAAGVPYAAHASVMGVADDPAFVKDAFFDYIESVRARPLRLQVQFNTWFDSGSGVNRAAFSNSVALIHQKLVVERGCRPLSAYVIDDGWQDVQSDWSDGVWKVNGKFDPDFAASRAAVRRAASNLGLWLSPGCLFGAQRQVPKLRQQGYEALDNWMSMAGPVYMQALETRMVELTRQGVGFFKLDGIFGHLNKRDFELRGGRYGLPELPQLGVDKLSSDDVRLNDGVYDEAKIYYLTAGAERLIEMFKKQAEVNPRVFILISNGAWLSPWWLMHVDASWMINAGDAAGGSSRTEELVYRDERYHEFWVRQQAQFPLCAVFNHEPKKLDSREPKAVFRNYLYMHLSRGSGFVELYIKPSRLADYDWDVLAEGLQWAEAVFPAFGRARMHGGNPGAGDVYGYTAWRGGAGYLSVHNPSDETRAYSVTLDRAFGLPSEPAVYHVSSPLEGSMRGLPATVRSGATLTFRLEPREIRVINFSSDEQAWSALKRLQGRTAEDFTPELPPKSVPVGEHPLLGLWRYTHGGAVYTRAFTADGLCRLRQGEKLVWTKPFTAAGEHALVVEGRYRHEARADGTLAIEGRYTAERVVK